MLHFFLSEFYLIFCLQLLFGMCVLPFVYCLSFLFTSPLVGYAITVFVLSILSLVSICICSFPVLMCCFIAMGEMQSVEPPLRRRHRDQEKCTLNRGDNYKDYTSVLLVGTRKSEFLIEVSLE